MAWLRQIWNTFRPGALDRELEEEVRYHLDLRARDLELSGMGAEAARAEAARQFGNCTLEKERMRDMDISSWIETILKDVQYAFRQLRRNPGFTAVAVASLALGIGANTAIFSALNAALLRVLPVRNPRELVMLTDPNTSGIAGGIETGERSRLTYAEFVQLRDHSTTLSGMCASGTLLERWMVGIGGSTPEYVRGRLVTEGYFSVLGVEPAIGRLFTEEEATGTGKDPYAVISHRYWQRRFGGNRAVLGTAIHLHRTKLTIIGVAAPGFRGETVGQDPDLWVPMMMQPLAMPGRDWLHEDVSQALEKVMWLHVFGRLRPGVTIAKAQAEVTVLFRGIIEAGYPQNLSQETRRQVLDQRIVVRDARTGAFGRRGELSQQLLVLLAAAGLVLLIACANVANLLLARATTRYKEVGVRVAIGAARGRLVRQFITESVLLSLLGGTVGVLLAASASRALLVLLSAPTDPLQAPLDLSIGFDWRVLTFAAGATIVTALTFGVAPAIRATRVDIIATLKETGRGVTNAGRRMTIASTLVITQVALSLMLVVGAGLFLRTLWNLQSVGLGYPKEKLLLVWTDFDAIGYKDAGLVNLYRDVADRIRTLPGVHGVTYSLNGLFSAQEAGTGIEVEGFTPRGDDDRGSRFDEIGPGYFSTIGIPMLLGREFGLRDTSNAPRVCIINEAFAKRFFSGLDPIGKHITDVFGDNRIIMEVVGVAKNARDHELRADVPPRFYVPVDQVDQSVGGVPASLDFEVRTTGDPERMLTSVRKAILSVNGDVSISNARPLGELVDTYNAQARLIAKLCTIFGIIALLLAATGLYGVLSYRVARRTSEIGIRMALGAGQGEVIRMILRETGLLVAIGLIAGLLATGAGTRLIATQLYGLTATDPLTIAIALCVLSAIALISGYIPAVRATRVNPVTALRHE